MTKSAIMSSTCLSRPSQNEFDKLLVRVSRRVEEMERRRAIAEDFEESGWKLAERLANELYRYREVLQWVHDGSHTGGHTLPDIKEAVGEVLNSSDIEAVLSVVDF